MILGLFRCIDPLPGVSRRDKPGLEELGGCNSRKYEGEEKDVSELSFHDLHLCCRRNMCNDYATKNEFFGLF